MDKLKSPNFNPDLVNTDEYIILHHTGGNKQSTINTFMDPSKELSAHYLIDKDGGITSFGDDSKVMYHAGTSHWGDKDSMNRYSIGIEFEMLGNDAKGAFSSKVQ